MGSFTFDERKHEYRISGVVVPSVTQIIGAAGLSGLDRVPADLLERNAAFGKAVHKAVELKCQEKLDYSTLDEALKPYVEQWDKFCNDFGYVSHMQEYRAVSHSLRVGFCIDNIGYAKSYRHIVDLKTGTAKPSDIIQACAYGYLYPTDRILLLYLRADRYRVVAITDRERKRVETVFLSCLSIYNFKKEKGLL